MANLLYQMTSAINSAFGENGNGGISKRSIKHENFQEMKKHVLSYSERERLKDTAKMFTKWVKENHPEIKMVRDLNQEIAKEFLLSKHKFNGGTCNSNTVNTYQQGLDKIAILCNKKFGCTTKMDVDHAELPQDGVKLRSIVMKRSIYDEALATMKDNGQSKQCLQIAKTMAMRTSEFENLRVMDINFNTMKLHIHGSKGGRHRDIGLSRDAAEVLQKRISAEGLSGSDKIFTIRQGTICKSLSRALNRIGHKEYAEARTSVHSVRKMVAQEMYGDRIRAYLNDGKPFEKAEKMALGDTSEFLGHGKQRTIEAYVERYGSLGEFEDSGL